MVPRFALRSGDSTDGLANDFVDPILSEFRLHCPDDRDKDGCFHAAAFEEGQVIGGRHVILRCQSSSPAERARQVPG